MPYATLTSKGQTTIPKEIRERLRLKPGSRMLFHVDVDGRVVVASADQGIDAIYGLLHRPGRRPLSIAEIDAAIAKGAVERVMKGVRPARRRRFTAA